MVFSKVAVIGVGLIGGSFALALKEAKAVPARRRRRPQRRQPGARARARRHRCRTWRPRRAPSDDADLVLVAAPGRRNSRRFSLRSARCSRPSAIVTDAGSTKRDVVAAARKALKRRIARFVPAHPIAGAEKSGAGAAQRGAVPWPPRGAHAAE